MSDSKADVSQLQFINVDAVGVVYNRDHLVKIDLKGREQHRVVLHLTTGVDEYNGEVADQIAQFFSPIVPAAAPEPSPGAKRAKR